MKINISKKYKETIVFSKFEMEIYERKINVILGPSGCGKTTLLQMIANLVDYEGMIENEFHKIGYVFQEDRLFPYLTIYKNLYIIDQNKDMIDYFLKEFQVEELKNKYPHELSGGEKQRISIIRAFLGNKDLILMDEPFKSLDFNLKLNLIEMILEIQKSTQKTIVLVTHDLDIAMYLGDYIHVLSKKVTRLVDVIQNKFKGQELNEESVSLRNHLKNSLK